MTNPTVRVGVQSHISPTKLVDAIQSDRDRLTDNMLCILSRQLSYNQHPAGSTGVMADKYLPGPFWAAA